MENLFANTGIGKHIIRTHHWGIVLPTLEKAEAFMKTFGLQEDYRGHVKAYDADLIFTKHGNGVDAVEFIIPWVMNFLKKNLRKVQKTSLLTLSVQNIHRVFL